MSQYRLSHCADAVNLSVRTPFVSLQIVCLATMATTLGAASIGARRASANRTCCVSDRGVVVKLRACLDEIQNSVELLLLIISRVWCPCRVKKSHIVIGSKIARQSFSQQMILSNAT